mmetsp:Transcript_21868/g.52254  ORF Transcript_21868/g.52254 Transcript_21868/m.52254 type:complete len:170 (+) Transcript_21868:617-1126(+)
MLLIVARELSSPKSVGWTENKPTNQLADSSRPSTSGAILHDVWAAEWMNFIFSTLKPAIPDFNWAPFEGRFGGQVDNEGWCLCSVEATGHHTNADLELEGLPALPASGAHFCLPQQLVKVKVDLPKRRIKAIEVVPKHGASVADLYAALGGRLPEGSLDEREGRRGAEA